MRNVQCEKSRLNILDAFYCAGYVPEKEYSDISFCEQKKYNWKGQ